MDHGYIHKPINLPYTNAAAVNVNPMYTEPAANIKFQPAPVMPVAPVAYAPNLSAALVLVLFILLVIALRAIWFV